METWSYDCGKCTLHSKTTRPYIEGVALSDEKPSIVTVLEAPGAEEEKHGEPIIGPTGMYYRGLLSDAGLYPFVFATNAVICRPPGNRDPNRNEIRWCNQRLMDEIEMVNPKVIIACGRPALIALGFSAKIRIGSVIGSVLPYGDRVVIPTWHPSYADRRKREGDTSAEMAIIMALNMARERLAKKVKPQEIKLNPVYTMQEFARFVEAARAARFFIYDWETTGTKPYAPDRAVLTAAFHINGENWGIPVSHPKSPLLKYERWIVKHISQLLMLAIPKGAHGRKFEISYWLACHGVWAQHLDFDTLLMHSLIDENSEHDLTTLSMRYTDMGAYDAEIKPVIGNLKEEPVEKVLEYNQKDVECTSRVLKKFWPEVRKGYRALYDSKLHECDALCRMEAFGLNVDEGEIVPFQSDLDAHMARYMQLIRKNRKVRQLEQDQGAPFNPNSTPQKRKLLFEADYLGLPILGRSKKTKEPNTGAEVLDRLKGKSKVVHHLIGFNRLGSLHKNYIKPMPLWVDTTDGRAHTNYTQHVVVTGRLSSTFPNLMNIPRGDKVSEYGGLDIKRVFGSRWKNGLMLRYDYNQQELRLLAWACDEKNMKAAFKRGEDIHDFTTANLGGVDMDEVSDVVWYEKRTRYKRISFGIVYGITDRGLSRDLRCSLKKAREALEEYGELYPSIFTKMDEVRRLLLEQGYVENLMGRRRRFRVTTKSSDEDVTEAARKAFNFLIQSAAAEIMRRALYLTDEWLMERQADLGYVEPTYQEAGMDVTVYDSLGLDCPPDWVRPSLVDVKRIMEEQVFEVEPFASIDVPLLVDVTAGGGWSNEAQMDVTYNGAEPVKIGGRAMGRRYG